MLSTSTNDMFIALIFSNSGVFLGTSTQNYHVVYTQFILSSILEMALTFVCVCVYACVCVCVHIYIYIYFLSPKLQKISVLL